MKLNFSQGVVRHQTDANGNPTFLQRSGSFVNLVVSPTPTILAFMHHGSTYIVEELKTVSNAWGPISSPQYLYWDVNLLNGTLTRGMTALSPVYSSASPVSPLLDQHWFDTDTQVMCVWTNQGWQEKIRLFAGYVNAGSTLPRPQQAGVSQAGIIGDFDGGNIVLDSFGMPLRQANGSFVTTVTGLNVVNLGTITTRLEGTIASVMAQEEIPKFHLVSMREGRRVVLARSDDFNTRIAGVVMEDLYEGDVAKIITTGIIRSPEFSWPASSVNKPLFCDTTGRITLTAPVTGVIQQVGFVYDVDAVFVNIHQVIVLDNPFSIPEPPSPPIAPPIANFTATPLSGVAPLDVTFTSTAVGALMIEWDFANNGFIDTTGAQVFKTYNTPGSYTVRQRVTNGFGVDEEIKISYISVTSPTDPPIMTNLGLSFGAPLQVTAGQNMSFQVVVTNDGLLDATDVARRIVLKADNSSQLTVVSPPPGATVSYSNGKTGITLPLIPLTSGSSSVVTMQVAVQGDVARITMDGTVTSPETDSTTSDNSASLSIEARP